MCGILSNNSNSEETSSLYLLGGVVWLEGVVGLLG